MSLSFCFIYARSCSLFTRAEDVLTFSPIPSLDWLLYGCVCCKLCVDMFFVYISNSRIYRGATKRVSSNLLININNLGAMAVSSVE